jgi:thioredoxin reductase (NADPH)
MEPTPGELPTTDPSPIIVYGAPWCPDCRRAKQFLNEQRVRYRWVDIEADDAARSLVEGLQGGGRTIPTIVFPEGDHLLEPSNAELAARLGLKLTASRSAYDLLIIGAGPTGLSAAMFAAREGIEVLVIERAGLGGQAGVTDRVDNYPGFPDGISGAELSDRLVAHARRYGVELLEATSAAGVHPLDVGRVKVSTEHGGSFTADAVLVATGSRYRRLGIPGESGLVGAGVHFCATCDGPFYRGADELVVVGGGNSALEEALFLTTFAERVRILARGGLRAGALVRSRVEAHPRIEVETDTDILSIEGRPGAVELVRARRRAAGTEVLFHPAAVFVFVGLDPNTGFVRGTLDLDERGFVVTDDRFRTSLPGVFAAGDVRAGSTKQVGTAAGEGIAALFAIRAALEAGHLARRARYDEGEPEVIAA